MAHVFLAWLCKQESLVDDILELCVHFIGRSKEGIVYIDVLRIYWIIFSLNRTFLDEHTNSPSRDLSMSNTIIAGQLFYVYTQSANFFSNLV